MNRKEFIKNSMTMGLGLPFLGLFLNSCSKEDFIETPELKVNFSGKVLIVGAGAAGLTAGYILHRNNIDFEIIEAAPIYGGRVKRNSDFIDLPLDLGAEWMHREPTVLAEIINDSSVNAQIDFVNYTPKTMKVYKDGKLRNQNWVGDFLAEHKFKSTTWYGFYEKFIAANIEDKIRLNQPVNQIDYSDEKVRVTVDDGTIYEGDKVLVTVPINILKKDIIEFMPALPAEKTEAIGNIAMGGGLKVFIEFSERFYPDSLVVDGIFSNLISQDKLYFNGVFGKETNRNVLTLFAVNDKADAFTNLGDDQAIFEGVMAELDEIFDGKASQFYVKHIVQNWTAEPYIQGSYSGEFDGNQSDIVNTIVEPLDNKIYFAGEAFSIENQATAHGAAESAYLIMEEILK